MAKYLKSPSIKKHESAQYNVALAGRFQRTNTVKPYQKLGLVSLQNKRKLRRLSLFYKIYKEQSPFYIQDLIASKTPSKYLLRNVKEISMIKVRQVF